MAKPDRGSVRIAPQLSVRNGRSAVEFYQAAFGATEVYRVGGTERHPELVSQLIVGDATFWVSDESPELRNFSPETVNGATARMLLVVDDPDSVVVRAIAAGGREVHPVVEEHGWLLGRIEDPYGHHWEIGRPLVAWPPPDGSPFAHGATSGVEGVLHKDLVHGWTEVYPHLRYEDPTGAIAWLTRVFAFRELVRMAEPDGSVITSKLETPGGGLVMVAGSSQEFAEWIRERVPGFQERRGHPWPNVSHTTTVIVDDVDAHYGRAEAEGATIVMPPTDHPWGLRSYAAIDVGGHQWEFAQILHIVEPEAWGAARLE
jgi:PhnB protein